MKALYWDGSGALEGRQDAEPAIVVPTDALVRPVAVAISYHISCGACDRCQERTPLFCRASYDQAITMYGMPIGEGYGGLFCELIKPVYVRDPIAGPAGHRKGTAT